jgi:hypothetical protein
VQLEQDVPRVPPPDNDITNAVRSGGRPHGIATASQVPLDGLGRHAPKNGSSLDWQSAAGPLPFDPRSVPDVRPESRAWDGLVKPDRPRCARPRPPVLPITADADPRRCPRTSF